MTLEEINALRELDADELDARLRELDVDFNGVTTNDGKRLAIIDATVARELASHEPTRGEIAGGHEKVAVDILTRQRQATPRGQDATFVALVAAVLGLSQRVTQLTETVDDGLEGIRADGVGVG